MNMSDGWRILSSLQEQYWDVSVISPPISSERGEKKHLGFIKRF